MDWDMPIMDGLTCASKIISYKLQSARNYAI
jgi:hypothetical protein